MTYPNEATGGMSDDDPPSDETFMTKDARACQIAEIMQMIWRIIWIVTERGAKPLQTIALYCKDVTYVYYAVHPSDRASSFARLESVRHGVDGPIRAGSIEQLSDRQVVELYTIVTHELKQLTESRRKG